MSAGRQEKIVLAGERLVLRPPRLSDAGRIRRLAGDWRVASRLGSMPYPLGYRDVFTWLREVRRDRGVRQFAFALEPTAERRLCGVVTLFELLSGQPAVGFWLGAPYWGRGLMSEALALVTAFAFERLNAPSLGADYLLDNPASGRVLQKAGFIETGVSPLWSRARMSYQPGCTMRLTRENWRANRFA